MTACDCVCRGGEGGMSVGECKLAAPNDVSNVHQRIMRNYNSIWLRAAVVTCGL